MARKMWGGRFAKATDPLVEQFTSSIAVDHRLAPYDVIGSIAHAKMLGRCGIIRKADAARLVRGLERILAKWERGQVRVDPSAEDIHSQIQALLDREVGAVAGTLHTARSRNDQVALDLRLYCRDAVALLRGGIAELQRALVSLAETAGDAVIPGYTHLQRAQPVLLAHHLLAYVEMLARDDERLTDALPRINVLPLGAGALAGTSLPIDRQYVAKLLGFARVADNSLDAVSDRDFAIEVLADLALLAMHLSRFAEDVILWATEEFGIIELDEAFATGSSLMPQKKNPDVVELIRGQAGLVSGSLIALLTVLKGLPLSYNRDLQWDKSALFGSVEGAQQSLQVLAPLVRHLRIRRERLGALLESGALCATDLAEHLVGQGVPFRQAHELVGRFVRTAEQRHCRMGDLPLSVMQRLSPHFDTRAKVRLSAHRSVRLKVSWGSTNPTQVARAVARWRARLARR